MASLSGSRSGSRKRLKLQDDSLIKELEDNITASISSNASLNRLADLISLTASLHNPQSVLKAIYACYRVFVLLISKGCLESSTSEQEKLVRVWILERLDEYVRFLTGLLKDEESLLRVRHTCYDFISLHPSHPTQTSALNILMSLLKHLSSSLTRSSQTPQFHVPHFKKVIAALLMCPPSERGGKKQVVQGVLARGLDAELRDLFVSKWLNVYIDVRWFFLRDAEYDFCSPKESIHAYQSSRFRPVLSSSSPTTDQHVPENLLAILERLESIPTTQSDLKSASWWVEELQAKPAASKNAPTVSDPDSDDDVDATEDDWRKFFDDEKQKKPSGSEPSTRLHRLTVHRSLHSLASHRAVFTRVWLRLLPRLSGNNDAGRALSLRVLNVMHRGVMPHLTRAVMVMDWVSGCVDYGRCRDIFRFPSVEVVQGVRLACSHSTRYSSSCKSTICKSLGVVTTPLQQFSITQTGTTRLSTPVYTPFSTKISYTSNIGAGFSVLQNCF
jgi:U3 small nucleolar RNA-associated protein 19